MPKPESTNKIKIRNTKIPKEKSQLTSQEHEYLFNLFFEEACLASNFQDLEIGTYHEGNHVMT